jgi:hypothetical protein
MQTCQSVGSWSNGLDEVRADASLREKAHLPHMTDLARAGQCLVLRFRL